MTTLPQLAQWSWVSLLLAPIALRLLVPAPIRRRWLRLLFFPLFLALIGINVLTSGRGYEATRAMLAVESDFVDAAVRSADRSRLDWQLARFISTSQGDQPIHVFADGILDPFWLRLVGVRNVIVDSSFRFQLTRNEAAELSRFPAKQFSLLEGESWTPVVFHLVQSTADAKAYFVLKEAENNYWIVPDTRMPTSKKSS